MKKIILSMMISLLFCFTLDAYGHGLGLETIKLDNNGKKIDITTQITPTDFSEIAKKKISILITDSLTSQNLDVILQIILNHEGKQIFKEYFFVQNGLLEINIDSTKDDTIKIIGNQEAKFNAWYGTELKPLEISGPILNSGGLYNFELEIKDIREFENKIFTSSITVVTNHNYDELDKNENHVKFNVKSYYDKLSRFNYEPLTNSITFEMPFDWSEQNLSHTQVVHEEIHFPKRFSDFITPSYIGSVNGIELFKSAITIDDYSSEDERIIHFVLSQDTLKYLKQAQKNSGMENPQGIRFSLQTGGKIVFPVVAMTKDESIQVDLSWEPEVIEPGKNTKFIYTFRNGKTGDLLRNTSYEFVISQNEHELYRKSSTAQIGGDFADYTFSKSQTGVTIIKFENLRGSSMGTEFGITVIPEFGMLAPIVMVLAISISMINGNRFRRSLDLQKYN